MWVCVMDEFFVDVSLFEADFIIYFESCFRILIIAFIEFFGVAVTVHVIIVDDKSIKQIYLTIKDSDKQRQLLHLLLLFIFLSISSDK